VEQKAMQIFLPGNHAGTIGTVYNGNIDGFVAEISNNGSAIIRSLILVQAVSTRY
jgi:hypothetical protein